MDYTVFFLFSMGFSGMVVQFLVKLDSINRRSDGKVNFRRFIVIERFSILISLIVVVVSSFLAHEIKQLELAGKWLGLGSFSIGYMSQSLLIRLMDKIDSYLDHKKRPPNKM